MNLRLLTALIIATGLALATPASAEFSQLIVFGDSLSDDGDGLTGCGQTPPPDPYFEGRITNGLVWAEVYAEMLGVPVTSLAISGALSGPSAFTGFSNVNGFPCDDVNAQVANFIADAANVPADPDALYVVFSGSNDFFDLNFFTGSMGRVPTEAEVTQVINRAVGNVVSQVTQLAGIGAKSIAIVNLPDASVTPLGIASPAEIQAGFVATTDGFNGILSTAIFNSNSTINVPDDVLLIPLDIAAFNRSVAADPAGFGIENVTDRCLDAVTFEPCDDPDTYAFWDDVHPTAAGHQILAEAFAAEIDLAVNPPPPNIGINPPGSGTGSLGPFALFALILLGRRRR